MNLDKKALELFNEWLILSEYRESIFKNLHVGKSITKSFWNLPSTVKNALIIEWLDSVGIYLEIGAIHLKERGVEYHYNIQQLDTLNGINGEVFSNRQEAISKAIEKCNEIINS